MAYSPIEQGRMLDHAALREVAARHDATPAQVALAWLTRQDGVDRRSRRRARARMSRKTWRALDLKLTRDDLATLDRAFPPPKKPQPLDML